TRNPRLEGKRRRRREARAPGERVQRPQSPGRERRAAERRSALSSSLRSNFLFAAPLASDLFGAKQEMADAPLLPSARAEKAGGRKKEKTPPGSPDARLACVDTLEHFVDRASVRVEIGKPVHRGFFIMAAAPTPFPLDREDVRIETQ